MKKIYLIYISVILVILSLGYFSNYPMQSIVNWIYNNSDSTINVRIKSASVTGFTVINVSKGDTVTHSLQDTLTTPGRADTIVWGNYYAYRYKSSIVCLLDTINVIRIHYTGIKDSLYLSANQTSTSDYLNPLFITKTIVKRKNNNSQFAEQDQGL